jgi:hypothetical protein
VTDCGDTSDLSHGEARPVDSSVGPGPRKRRVVVDAGWVTVERHQLVAQVRDSLSRV